MTYWLKEENSTRKEKYKRNESDEDFLSSLNKYLSDFGEADNIEESNHPLILFYGLPRCGKTFFSQAMMHCLDLGVVNNLTARFWLAPEVGIRLSDILDLNSPKSEFQSDYGKTSHVGDPHDFAYFWFKWLNCSGWPPSIEEDKSGIHWDELGTQLHRMFGQWKKPALMKGVIPSYYMADIHKAYPNTFFVYLERDLIDVAISLMKGRRDYFDDENALYGQQLSLEHAEHYKTLTAADSVITQLSDLMGFYEEQISQLNPETHIRIRYDQFCMNPNAEINRIVDKVESAFGYQLQKKSNMPEDKIRISKRSTDHPDYARLEGAILRANLKPRYET